MALSVGMGFTSHPLSQVTHPVSPLCCGLVGVWGSGRLDSFKHTHNSLSLSLSLSLLSPPLLRPPPSSSCCSLPPPWPWSFKGVGMDG